MTALEIAAIAMLLVGIGAGGFLVAQRPSFWAGLAAIAFRAALPVILKRMPPEQEAEMRRCILSGGTWDHHRRRCKR